MEKNRDDALLGLYRFLASNAQGLPVVANDYDDKGNESAPPQWENQIASLPGALF